MARILIIDDDDIIRVALQRLLEFQGHEVLAACDGKMGSKLYREHTFDLIVTDIYMPEMDGLEIVMDIKKVSPDTRVIAISGEQASGPVSYLSVAQRFGASRVLKKPFEWSDLLNAVSEVLAE